MPSEDKELKIMPCPFCGSKAEIFMKDYVRCSSKECFMWGRNPIKAWNTRSKPQDPCCGVEEIDDYDIGLIGDGGGGDISWWQDYIRSVIGGCNDYWREQLEHFTTPKCCGDLVDEKLPLEIVMVTSKGFEGYGNLIHTNTRIPVCLLPPYMVKVFEDVIERLKTHRCCGKKVVLPDPQKFLIDNNGDDLILDKRANIYASDFLKLYGQYICQQAINQQVCGRGLSEEEEK